MSYPATVFRVMIASPGDVQDERDIARKLIFEWNSIHSEDKQIVLLPLGWEHDSYSQMGSPPQDILNEELLKKTDVLVGIFWKKIGTPTKVYASGSIEELERHIASGKPTMLYFSKVKVDMDEVDAKQYELVKKFKETYKDRGLYWEYKDLNNFKDIFKDQLMMLVNNNSYFSEQIKHAFDQSFFSSVLASNEDEKLREESITLLREATEHGDGSFVKYGDLSGMFSIQVRDKTIIETKENREIAKWKEALEELQHEQMIEDVGYNGFRYEILNAGYEYLEKMT